VLRKFGQYAEVRESHSNIFIIGNDRTGLWKKVLGISKMEEIAATFRSVLNDEGGTKR
jgi:protein SCO1